MRKYIKKLYVYSQLIDNGDIRDKRTKIFIKVFVNTVVIDTMVE